MPSYLYRCRDCGHQFEERLPVEARDSVSNCPHCGGSQVHRVVAVLFVAAKAGNGVATLAGSGCGCGGKCGCGTAH